MSKSFPKIDIRCDECEKEMRIPLVYESVNDRWTRANGKGKAMVWFKSNHKGWHLHDGMEARDYCPKHHECCSICAQSLPEAEKKTS